MHHVALVLGPVGTALDRVPTVAGRADPRVVAGGDRIEPEQVGPLGEPGELHRPVALDARVRRGPLDVGRDVRLDDVGGELVAEVEHQVIDVELLADPSGIVDVADRAATRVAVAAPQFHRHADHLVPGLLEQQAR